MTFTMLAPTSVSCHKANPVFAAINQQAKSPSWNFNKHLLDANGKVVEHFGSRVKPDDQKLVNAEEMKLAKKLKHCLRTMTRTANDESTRP